MRQPSLSSTCPSKSQATEEANGDDIAVLSNVVSSQVELHAQYGGVVPALAAREHVTNIGKVFDAALKEAGITNPEPRLTFGLTAAPAWGLHFWSD